MDVSVSAQLPLHDGLIITTNTEEPLSQVASAKLDSDHMLRMTSVARRHTSLSARVSENIDKAEVITSGDQILLLIHVYTVDVWTISFSWEDAIDAPAKLAVLRCPNGSSCVWGTRRILITRWNNEEEKLVAIADRSQISAILTPVHASDCCIMIFAFVKQGVTIIDIVDVNVGVMGSCSEIIAIWTVFTCLNPFEWVH